MSARVESLLEQLVTAQQQTNRLLVQMVQLQDQLIHALAEDDADPDAEPVTYMDGSPIR
ncbi:hypothetical protein D3C79_1106870 [compost metagenome]